MMSNLLQELLETRPWLLADGATGTNLFDMGLQTGDAPELWNVDHPDRIARHYQSFIDAGSDIILTNTFGGSAHRLKLHNAQDRVAEINRAAARIARERADRTDRPVVVAGSMGPTGEILEPAGTLTHDEARAAFSDQAAALGEGGVDMLWIETMSSIEEVGAAVAGAGDAGLPVVVTFSIDTNGRTMMGVTPSEIIAFHGQLSPVPIAFGANCGTGAAEVVAAVINMKNAADASGLRPVIVAKANCGIPEYRDGKIVYTGTPELMARYATLVHDAGATIIGGCCGTTPDHVRRMREALEQHPRGPAPAVDVVVDLLGEISTGARAQLRGEMSVQAGAKQAAARSSRPGGRRRRG
jgi:5-methyltetrahydrofolate--homocysteine methyltransferase